MGETEELQLIKQTLADNVGFIMNRLEACGSRAEMITRLQSMHTVCELTMNALDKELSLLPDEVAFLTVIKDYTARTCKVEAMSAQIMKDVGGKENEDNVKTSRDSQDGNGADELPDE